MAGAAPLRVTLASAGHSAAPLRGRRRHAHVVSQKSSVTTETPAEHQHQFRSRSTTHASLTTPNRLTPPHSAPHTQRPARRRSALAASARRRLRCRPACNAAAPASNRRRSASGGRGSAARGEDGEGRVTSVWRLASGGAGRPGGGGACRCNQRRGGARTGGPRRYSGGPPSRRPPAAECGSAASRAADSGEPNFAPRVEAAGKIDVTTDDEAGVRWTSTKQK